MPAIYFHKHSNVIGCVICGPGVASLNHNLPQCKDRIIKSTRRCLTVVNNLISLFIILDYYQII